MEKDKIVELLEELQDDIHMGESLSGVLLKLDNIVTKIETE